MRITWITVWFGQLPPYLDKFIARCNAQGREWKFIMFNDQGQNASKGNFTAIHQSQEDFTNLSRKKFGLDIVPTTKEDPRKTVDARPLFGDMYSEYLEDADFWAYGEIDVVYGNLNNFVNYPMLLSCDVFSVGKEVSSNMTIFHNDGKNQLYRLHPNWKFFVTDGKLHGFDEHTISVTFQTAGLYTLYWYAHSHDAQPWHDPKHQLFWCNGQLMDMGWKYGPKEVMMHHFSKSDVWPEIADVDPS
jgi:hypothetical protein